MTVHIEHCMGTVFTIDIRDPGDWDVAIAEVVAWLHHVDAVFSTYKDDSDISRIRRGELERTDADPDVGPILALCAELERETGGYFTSFHGADIDPSGAVKGWSIERASELLRRHGSQNHGINGGGDMQLAGEAGPGRAWTVGISDPFDPAGILTTVTGRNFAVATSGTAERGHHIVDPHTGAAAGELASVTVTGRSLTRADAYATAAFAMGRGARDWIESLPDHEGLVVSAVRTIAATRGFHRSAAA